MATSVLVAASAQAASAAQVKVVSRSGDAKEFNIAGLSGQFDVDNPYDIFNTNGTKVTDPRVSGISISKLLTLAGADATYGKVSISNGSSKRTMTRTQIESSTYQPPVIYERNGQGIFLRPSYAQSADVNGADILRGDTITVTQEQINFDDGPIVTGKASKTKVKARESVTFTASVTNQSAGEQFVYKWVFSGGGTAKGVKVKHAWKTDGPHTAQLTATPVGDTASIPAPVIKITVGKLAASNKKREGGGNNENAAAPTAGSTNGDSGAGQQSNAETTSKTKKTKKKKAEQPDSGLERVTGELMSATVTPVVPQSALAARSGQQVVQKPESFGMTPTQVAFSIGFLLLLGGVLIELGVPQAIHRYLHDH